MTDAEYIAAFEGCTLTPEQWTHRAHVRMAWIYLTTGEQFESVLTNVRRGIQRHNVVVLKKPGGYHETITYAFLRIIKSCLHDEFAEETFDEFCRRQPTLLSPSVLERYFSKELLASEKARQEAVPPDLSPLP